MSIGGTIRAIAILTAGALPLAANAAETGGCGSFAWPLTTELQWLKASDSEAATSGLKIASPPGKAITLSLQPMKNVAFPVAPTARQKSGADELFGGFVEVTDLSSAGLYQITMGTGGWADVVQKGKTLKPTAHSGKSDCDGARKSLRFSLEAGPVTLEFSNIKEQTLRFTIRHAE